MGIICREVGYAYAGAIGYFSKNALTEQDNLVDYLLAGTEACRHVRAWAISSGGEHYLDTVGVTSSNLVSPTMKLQVRQHIA